MARTVYDNCLFFHHTKYGEMLLSFVEENFIAASSLVDLIWCVVLYSTCGGAVECSTLVSRGC